MKDEISKPLRWALRCLSWFCPSYLLEEIEGDLLQQFHRDAKNFGERKATRRFVWNAIRFFRPGIVLRNKFSVELNSLYMLRNYFKISTRMLLKNKVFSVINISGLAIGMAAFLLIVHYIQFERSYENFNKNADNIYRVTLDVYKGDEYVITDCEMYAPIGPMLAEKFPEVLDFTRMYEFGIQEVKVEGKAFYEERIYLADPSALTIFSFQVLTGNSNSALSAPFQAAITESNAKKYFGRTDVVGESIEIGKKIYKITAVLADTPANTHLKVNFLLSHATAARLWNYNENEFSGNNEYTYLLMVDNTDLLNFNSKLKKLSLELKDKMGDDRLMAEPMKDIHLYSDKSYEPEANGNAQSVYFLLIIAIFILLIAWINYINLSTARAVDRAKEVGIRKVMGSLRGQLIFQFLSESIVVSLLATALCLFLIYFSMPVFIQLTGQVLPIKILKNKEFWVTVLFIFFVGSVLAGLYPAFVLSSFEPVSVLKGKFRSSSRGQWLRKGLVIFQFAAAVILIVCVCSVYMQLNLLQKSKLGMNINQVLVLRSPRIESDSLYLTSYKSLKKELLTRSPVQQVSKSGVVPGLSLHELSTTGNVFRLGQEKKDKGYIYYINSFDEDFIPTLEMKLAAGTNFNGEASAEGDVIINEEAVHTLGFKNAEEAIGSKLSFYDEEKTVVGVLENYYQRSPKEKHLPMVFRYNRHAYYFSMRIKTDEVDETIASVKASWDKVFPDSPFYYFFLDESYNQQYKSDRQFGQVIAVFSTLAAFIACLGLFGLSSFTIIQRTKEIGIRKVLGASIGQIVRLLSQDFFRLVIVAAALAIPFSYFAVNKWLANYATQIQMNALIFIAPIIMVLIIASVAVGFQTIKAAQRNPVDTLKNE